MKSQMPQRVYAGWKKYWDAEPWGPWRDNMHAAVIAREIRRTAGGKVPELSVWLLRNPMERAYEASGKVMSALQTIGQKMSPKEASEKLRLHKKSRQKSRPKKFVKKR